ncbi:hypothetical protein F4556_004631 [Kitasatospora gansuensis]|uniref:Uncharacterized protein n=1 Tax=Kitasatospora gansuensis TaxID=258050 RepID=A0A7W7WJ96_9ACTN|nr:hypothetical protein [Kitasatospora gansuensis]MBB4949096.1 hypothetical protein [Kitasatospora gansuensis]
MTGAAEGALTGVDAAFERGDPEVGTAVVRLVFSGAGVEEVAPRVVRALGSADAGVRRLGGVAAGDLARTAGRLTPQLYEVLRAEGFGGVADTAIKDVLTFVPFRRLPGWYRWQWLRLTVRDTVQGWWLRLVDLAETGWAALRRR